MKKRFICCIAVLFMVFLFACDTQSNVNGEYQTPKPHPDLGLYNLMVLKDGVYRFDMVSYMPSSTDTVTQSEGTYVVDDTEITFTETGGVYSFTGEVTNKMLSFEYKGLVYDMTKQ